MTEHNMDHMQYLRQIVEDDIQTLQQKESTYKGSWKMSGGRSAWFMLKRKIDRMINMMTTEGMDVESYTNISAIKSMLRAEDDIFLRAELDGSQAGADGTLLAEIQDLRRYLLLTEAELKNRSNKRDNHAIPPKKEAPREESHNERIKREVREGKYDPNIDPFIEKGG
jgi:hypothetical protein